MLFPSLLEQFSQRFEVSCNPIIVKQRRVVRSVFIGTESIPSETESLFILTSDELRSLPPSDPSNTFLAIGRPDAIRTSSAVAFVIADIDSSVALNEVQRILKRHNA